MLSRGIADFSGVAGFAKVVPDAAGAGGGARVYKRDSARTGLESKSILKRPSSANGQRVFRSPATSG